MSESSLTKTSIWEVVKDLESKKADSDKELGEIRATLTLNFGNNGRCIPNLVQGSETTITMMLKVLYYFYDKIGKAVKE
jgi:hypothetical protein